MSESEFQTSSTEKLGFFKKSVGTFCHYCPVCSYGRKKPNSIIGRMLHHPLHADHCPAWKAEKEIYPAIEGTS